LFSIHTVHSLFEELQDSLTELALIYS
jgi:hypothetical protein